MNKVTGFIAKEKLLCLVPAIVIPFILLASLRMTCIKKGDVGTDCYYHVRMSSLPVKVIASKQFPSMTLSIWHERFSNKELLFHLVLKAVQKISFIKEPEPPFHIYSFFLLLLFTLSFAVTAYSFSIKHIWFYSLVLFLLFPLLTMRIMFVRPHMIAMSLMCLSLALFKKVQQKKHLWIPFVFGFVFAWTYSSPHFILVTASAFAGIFIFRKEYVLGILIFLSTFLGLIAGLTIHPQFPNTFYIWFIQGVQIVNVMLFGAEGICVGRELVAPSLQEILFNVNQYILLVIDSFLLYRLFQKKTLKPETAGVFCIALFWSIMFFFAKRALEYSVFITVLATGIIISDCLKAGFFTRIQNYKKACLILSICIVTVLVPVTFKVQKTELTLLNRMPYAQFGEWVRKSNMPAGSRIANLYWGDFPFLFFSAPQHRYLFGIDPMFAYFSNPEKVKKIESLAANRIMMSPTQLHELTGADFLFMSHKFNDGKRFYDNNYRLIYQGSDGCLFHLINE